MKTFKNSQNILIIRTDRIGDVVLTTPSIKAVRQAYPTARISVLVSPGTYDLLKGNPYIDEVLIDDRKSQHKDLFGFLQLARQLRFRQFDFAIIFHTKRRYNLAAYIAGIPLRIGYKNNKLGSLLTHPMKDSRFLGQKHEAQYCLDLLSTIGIQSESLDLFVPSDKEAEAWASQWMEEHHLKPNHFIAIHPGASDTTKCWPLKNFAQLIDSFAERYQLKIVLVGAEGTTPLANEILKQVRTLSGVINLTGKTSLSQTISLLRRARVLISNDSGPVHVAAAVGSYVISLFLRNQPGINAKRWQPLGPKSFVLSNKPGEEVRLDQKGQLASGQKDSIQVEDVLDLLEQIFQKDNQSTFHW